MIVIMMCPNTMEGETVDSNGCHIFSLDANNFTIQTISETCIDLNNGQIEINAVDSSLSYQVTIDGKTHDFNSSTTITDLAPGTYELCISVLNQNYQQCYAVTIEEGPSISGKTSISSGKLNVEISSGTPPFNVEINGISKFSTESNYFKININEGDVVKIRSSKPCEGELLKSIEYKNISVYPNPASNIINIAIPSQDKKKTGTIEIYNSYGQLVLQKTVENKNGIINFNIDFLPNNLYIANLNFDNSYQIKFLKK